MPVGKDGRMQVAYFQRRPEWFLTSLNAVMITDQCDWSMETVNFCVSPSYWFSHWGRKLFSSKSQVNNKVSIWFHILTCESCQRSCTALSGFIRHCGEKERNAQIDEWCRPFFNNHDETPEIVFLTTNLKFALRQFFRKQSWKYENYFSVLCENQCCCLCCLPDAYSCMH